MTRAAVRTVAIPSFVCEELSRLAAQPLGPEALVFTSPEGQPVRATTLRQRYWTPATEVAGVAPLRIHDLRHTAVPSGSPKAPTPNTSPSEPATAPSPSPSTATATSTPTKTTS